MRFPCTELRIEHADLKHELLGHVSKIVSTLLSKLSNYANTDTQLRYCNAITH